MRRHSDRDMANHPRVIDGQHVERIIGPARQQPPPIWGELTTEVLGIQAHLEHRLPLGPGDDVEPFCRISNEQPTTVEADRTNKL